MSSFRQKGCQKIQSSYNSRARERERGVWGKSSKVGIEHKNTEWEWGRGERVGFWKRLNKKVIVMLPLPNKQ